MRYATVRIPAALRKYTGGKDEVPVEGSTVGEALACLYGTYDAIMDWLVDGKGNLQRMARVFLDGQEIRTLDGLSSPLQNGDILLVEVAENHSA